MSNAAPLSPFDPHSDLPEAGQSPWPQGQYGMQSETDAPFHSGASEQAPSAYSTRNTATPADI